MFFVGYSELFTGWLMKWGAWFANIVPVDPDVHLLQAMKTGAFALRKGLILCIFPEGGRSYDGELQEFKKGTVILSKELMVLMVPVGIMAARQQPHQAA
jgi:long-chain acyl-CoA synthetase